MAAALSYVGNSSREVFLEQSAHLPAPGRWLFCQQRGEQTVLAAAHGKQPYVFRQAVLSLAGEFAPTAEVQVLAQPEKPWLGRIVWLRKRAWLPGAVRQRLGQELWLHSAQGEGV